MEDYQLTLSEFENRFSTEENCRNYLFKLRWPDGFHCPRCGNENAWPISNLHFNVQAVIIKHLLLLALYFIKLANL